MNVLVLDFDGVVNNDSSIEQNTRYIINPTDLETSYIHYFVPQLIRNIKQLCDKFDFKIVISSTWRIDFSIEEMKSIFKNQFLIVVSIYQCLLSSYRKEKRLVLLFHIDKTGFELEV